MKTTQPTMNCPTCGRKDATLGHIIGHGARGIKKTISKAESKRRGERARHAQSFRWPKKGGTKP